MCIHACTYACIFFSVWITWTLVFCMFLQSPLTDSNVLTDYSDSDLSDLDSSDKVCVYVCECVCMHACTYAYIFFSVWITWTLISCMFLQSPLTHSNILTDYSDSDLSDLDTSDTVCVCTCLSISMYLCVSVSLCDKVGTYVRSDP